MKNDTSQNKGKGFAILFTLFVSLIHYDFLSAPSQNDLLALIAPAEATAADTVTVAVAVASPLWLFIPRLRARGKPREAAGLAEVAAAC